jgi:general secretion pathway protein K
MSDSDGKEENKESGFALIVVLSFLMIATAITTPFLISARIDALVSRNNGHGTQDKILLHGFIQVAALRYFELYQRQDKPPIKHINCRLPTGSLKFEFQDHSGLIDLNAASVDLLALGFESLAIAKDDATVLAIQVVHFRSVESARTMTTVDAISRNGYKHALFEHVSELQDLLVPTKIKSEQFDDVFTVHSGTGTIDMTAASSTLLPVLERLAPTERYFLVNDTRRTNAITISITLERKNHQQVRALAILGRGQNEPGAQFIGPLIMMSEGRDSNKSSSSPVPLCEEFFDPNLLQILQEVTT